MFLSSSLTILPNLPTHLIDSTRQVLGLLLSHGSCVSSSVFPQNPTLQNCLGHAVLRTDSELCALFPDKEGVLVTSDARNRVLHSRDTFEDAFDTFQASPDKATIPIPLMEDGLSNIPIFDVRSPSLVRLELKGRITLDSTWTGRGVMGQIG